MKVFHCPVPLVHSVAYLDAAALSRPTWASNGHKGVGLQQSVQVGGSQLEGGGGAQLVQQTAVDYVILQGSTHYGRGRWEEITANDLYHVHSVSDALSNLYYWDN